MFICGIIDKHEQSRNLANEQYKRFVCSGKNLRRPSPTFWMGQLYKKRVFVYHRVGSHRGSMVKVLYFDIIVNESGLQWQNNVYFE